MKKKNLQSMLALLCMLLFSITVSASTVFYQDGVYYFTLNDSTAAVTYRMTAAGYYNDYEGDVVIPEKVIHDGHEYTVTKILSQAMNNCKNVTSLRIPRTVTSIAHNSLVGCGGLQSIIVDERNPVYDSRDNCNAIIETASNMLQKGCNNTVIPYGVKRIMSGAFKSCITMTSIDIPASVTHIEDEAFSGTYGVESIHIPSSVEFIGNRAFYYCRSLMSVIVDEGNPVYDSRDNCNAIIETASNTLLWGSNNTVIPSSVTAIGDEAFAGRYLMTEITIPNTVTTIGEASFWGCFGLTSISIPESISVITTKAFTYCKGLERVDMANSVIDIQENAFGYCDMLTQVNFSQNLEHIGYMAFYDCSSLQTVNIPASVITIEPIAFTNTPWYNNLPEGAIYVGNILLDYKGTMPENTHLTVREGTTSIAGGALGGYKNLIGIDMPNSVQFIGDKAFYNDENLAYVHFSDSLIEIGEEAFSSCRGLTEIVLPNSLKKLGIRAFDGCQNVTDLTIGSSLDSISNNMFFYWYGVENIHVAEGNQRYDSRNGCNAIIETATGTLVMGASNTVIPDGVSTIGNHAFYGRRIRSIDIPNSVTTIAAGAFSTCRRLQNITIPNSVKTIGGSAFNSCDSLTEVIIPNSVTSLGGSAFGLCKRLTSIVLSDSLTSIESGTFDRCKQLTSIQIPDGVRSIGNQAFIDCSLLTNIKLPAALTSIGEHAFSGCTKLVDIIFPDSLISTGAYAFESTPWYRNQPDGQIYAGTVVYDYKGSISADTIITVREGTLGIGDQAFFYTPKMTAINLPNSLRAIGERAFDYCDDLTEVIVPDQVATIGNQAFCDCDNLRKVQLGKGVISAGRFTFNGSYRLRTVICLAQTIPYFNSGCYDSYCIYGATLYVPEAMVGAYCNAEGWRDFINIEGIPGAGPGDINGNNTIDISDVTALIDYLLSGQEAPIYADVNGDGRVTVSDISSLIDMILNNNL